MDWINGGQLLFHLREQAMFSESIVKFYLAEIILALEHLHSQGIIHRDLKPENLLLDNEGHIAITDFGLAKEVVCLDDKTNTFCGTLEYMAPEMVAGKSYTKVVDWWSVGILAFDLLIGDPPFKSKNRQTLCNKILQEKVKLPTYLTKDACSLIKGFLNRDETIRLGSGPDGIKKIKTHPFPFFKSINWRELQGKIIEPPFKPSCPKGELDVSNFDKEFLDQPVMDSPVMALILTGSQEELFKGFSYVRSPDINSSL